MTQGIHHATPQQLERENDRLRRRVAALEALEERFRATFDQAVVGMAHVGLDGRWLLVNQRLCDIVGYSREELQTRTFQSLTHPDDLEGDVGTAQKLVSGEMPKYTREKRYVRKDGSVVWVFLAITMVRNAAGEPAYFASVTEDIDERKRAETELREKTALLEAQANCTIDGILVVDPQGKKVFQNQRAVDLWKIPQAIADDADDKMQVQHVMRSAKYPERFLEKVVHLYGHPDETSRDEVELLDGTILDRYSAPVVGKAGRNYGRIWTFRDVTERRRLEDSLRLTQFSVDATADAILWIRPDGSLTYANDSMCRLLGYTREEMLALAVFDIDGAHTPETWRFRWEEARQKRTLSAQAVHRRKDGTNVPVEITSNFELEGKTQLCSFIRDISERKRTEEELFRLATTDSLTGALNRRYFNERCVQEIQRSTRYGGCLSSLMLDIDHFKRVNDTAGHAAGDEVLRAFARLCAAQLRATDLFGRLGGEEFAVALPGTSVEGAIVVGERLRATTDEARVHVNGAEIRFTVSVGVTEWAREERDMDDVHRRADQALYAAKEQGRNRVVVRRRDATLEPV